MDNIRPIAIYLPQYHTINENDEWWGKGFTEWTNVKKAQPLFEGHYQPHIPDESLGYYNLSDKEVLVKQAKMASEYGIYGFAFYHYWFNGKRLLNTPIDNMLATGKPDFPFCMIWANENWTKTWDGQEKDILIKQDYSFEDDRQHIEFLCKNIFSDKRYIRIRNKPIFIVYRTELFPDINKTTTIWQKIARQYGFEGLYLIRVESFEGNINPQNIGFDAAMEFAPDWSCCNQSTEHNQYDCSDYPTSVFNMLLKSYNYKVFRTVFPAWDNSPRKRNYARIFTNSTADVFRYYLQRIIEFTHYYNAGEKILFINAWNEWGEGCHVEPDKKNGFKYLKIIREETAHEQNNYYFKNLLNTQKKINYLINSNLYKLGKLIIKPLILFKRSLNA
jgi:lipopolysaccharide biosynthesis protein